MTIKIHLFYCICVVVTVFIVHGVVVSTAQDVCINNSYSSNRDKLIQFVKVLHEQTCDVKEKKQQLKKGASVYSGNAEKITKSTKGQKSNARRKKTKKNDSDYSVGVSFGNGRLGNQMSAFATLYSFEQDYNLKAYITRLQLQVFELYFDAVVIRKFRVLEDEYPGWKKFKWIEPFPKCDETVQPGCNQDYSDTSVLKTIPKRSYLDVGPFPNNVVDFKRHLNDLKDIFKLKKNSVIEAHQTLHQLTEMYYDRKLKTTSDPLTYISIHVRRSDYGMYLNYWYKKTYVEDEYFARAVQFYRNKFSNILFYVVSDDPDWTTPSLMSEDTFFTKNSSTPFQKDALLNEHTGYDLALLTQANHSILTYGTYGMWGALLASGSALLPVSHLNTLVSEEIRAGNVTDWMFI